MPGTQPGFRAGPGVRVTVTVSVLPAGLEDRPSSGSWGSGDQNSSSFDPSRTFSEGAHFTESHSSLSSSTFLGPGLGGECPPGAVPLPCTDVQTSAWSVHTQRQVSPAFTQSVGSRSLRPSWRRVQGVQGTAWPPRHGALRLGFPAWM
ncbi:hypothetical protein P7K49_032797 [Saguinus oedipus]|uniref:Uncharacterized protein n=1 Tax=Saguinus oedipus TaxID=9490 RepID=A0ABQ9TQV2_SAGOE|nr:hypothetical protein P7K49_032797 [Saguinus oedipus]